MHPSLLGFLLCRCFLVATLDILEILLVHVFIVRDLIYNVFHFHALREEVQKLSARGNEVENDGVVYQVVLLVVLVLIGLGDVKMGK